MARYNVLHEDFASFSINAHNNASTAAHALLKNKITLEKFRDAIVVDPSVPIKVLIEVYPRLCLHCVIHPHMMAVILMCS